MRRANLVVTRDQLIEVGWGYDKDVSENSVEFYIYSLRSKLRTQSGDSMIRTVRGLDIVSLQLKAMINFRSLRFRISAWYAIFTMSCMTCVGLFSWLYLHNALASSSMHTMDRRELRLRTFMDLNGEWKDHPGHDFEKRLSEFLSTGVESDVVEVFDMNGNRIYPLYRRISRDLLARDQLH